MNVIVDTDIWSRALRRKQKPDTNLIEKLAHLIDEGRVIMLGPIRQEILSGIKEKKQFELLKRKLNAYHDYSITTMDYEKAAEYFNTCRSKGIQGSNTDFLICAVAVNNIMSIFTLDKDFKLFSKFIPIKVEE